MTTIPARPSSAPAIDIHDLTKTFGTAQAPGTAST